MKGLVFFAGKYRLDNLGAVSVVARNLFSESPSKFSRAVIGMGRLANDLHESPVSTHIDLSPEYLRRGMPFRCVSKVFRECSQANAFSLKVQCLMEEKLTLLADKLAAKRLPTLFRLNSSISVAVGYSGNSLIFGQTAKAHGKRFVIHSQFCHPYVQNALIANACRSLGLRPPPIIQFRLDRQLATLELADLIWCPSDFVRRSLINNGIPSEKTFVSHLGIDVERFHVQENYGYKKETFTILFVGNVGIQKGVHVLLDSLEKVHIMNAIVVFNGVADSTAKQLIRDYSKRLVSRGVIIRLDPGDPRRYHKNASIFVLPSVHDAFGIVVLEAMAAGLPVIVSDHAGASELVRHGQNGFVLRSGNSKELADTINYFYNNREKIVEFGNVSREISKDFDIGRRATQHMSALFNRL